MKNLFLEKNIVQKLIIAVVIVILFNFASPTICNAKGFWASAGGALLEPILELIVSIFDAILQLLQTNLLTNTDIITPATSDTTKDTMGGIIKIIIGFVVVVGIICAVVATAGAAAPAIAGLSGATLTTATGIAAAATGIAAAGKVVTIGLLAIGGVVVTSKAVYNGVIEDFKGEFDVPTIVYTPFAIFSGLVPMFDINFFNPKTDMIKVWSVAEMFPEAVDVETETGADPETVKEAIRTGDALSIDARWTADWACQAIFEYDMYGFIYNGDANAERLNRRDYIEISAEAQESIDIISKWLENGLIYLNSDIQDELEEFEKGKGESLSWEEILWVASWEPLTYIECTYDKKIKDVTTLVADGEARGVVYSGYIAGEEDGYYINNLDEGFDFVTIEEYDENNNARTIKDAIDAYATTYGETAFLDETIQLYENTVTVVQNRVEYSAAPKTYENTRVAVILQDTVATWYVNLRNLALVCLLVILVYIGIRIVLSSTAPEKAKYKQMIINWVVALCILFLLHIIMIATLTVTGKITDALAGNCTEALVVNLPNGTRLADKNGDYNIDLTGGDPDVTPTIATNFIGYVRLQAGIYYTMGGHFFNGVAYVMMYVMLVVQTLMFTWVYAKRVVYMAFLTIIAPLVAITYPIDKIGDGKSQAFDMWLKEYIFNALLQPIHLLIYTALCGTAMDLVAEFPIYGIVCLAFVVPAEKFIRKMFGFEKAQTPSALGGAAGAALAMSGIQRLGNMIRPDGKDDREADKLPKANRIRTANAAQQEQMSSNAKSGRNKAAGIVGTNPTGTNPTGSGSTGTNPTGSGSTGTNPTGTNPTGTSSTGTNPTGTSSTGTSSTGTSSTGTSSTGTSSTGTNPTGTSSTGTSSTGTNPTGTNPTGTNPTGTNRTGSGSQQEENPEKFTTRGRRAIQALKESQKLRAEEAFFNPKKNARRRRKIRRAALGGALGFGAGLTMAATKMAMGANASDVITSTTAAGTAGYAIGSKGAQKIQEFEKMDDTRDALKDGWYTAEERRKQFDEEARKKAKQDPDTRALLREAFPDKEERRKVLEGEKGRQSWFDYCYDYGLQDPEAIIAAYKYMNSSDFQQEFSGNGITTEEQRAIALQAGKDIQRYGDVRNDYKKRTEMESMKKLLCKNDENLIRREQQAYDTDIANQRAEAASINQDEAALQATMAADADLTAREDEEREAMADLHRKEEEVRKAIEDNETLVAKDAQEVAKLEAEIARTQNDMQFYTDGGGVPDIEREIAAQQQIINDANATDISKQQAIAAKAQLEIDKENAKKKADEMRVELRERASKLQRELNNLRNRQTQRFTDAQKAAMEQEVTEKREIAERAKAAAESLRQTRYGTQLQNIEDRKVANNREIKSVEDRVEESATAMAKGIMRQYDKAMDQYDITTG